MKILLKESDELLLTAQPDEKIRIGDVILSESVLSQVIDIKFLTTNSIEAYILRKSLIPEENTTESIQPEISGMMGTLLDQKLLVTKIRGRLEDDGNGRRVLKTGITDLDLSREKTVPKKISIDELFEILELTFPDNTIAETLSENKGFDFDPRKLQLTLITGKKKSGKSYFAKRLLLRLIERGVFTLVFDVNQEYQRLGLDEDNQANGYFRNFVVLDPTINDVNGNRRPLRIPLNEITAEDFIDYLEITTGPMSQAVFQCWRALRNNQQFDLADVSAWIDGVNENGIRNVDNEMVRIALASRIRFAESQRFFGPLDVTNIVQGLRDGGALILSIGTLPNRFRRKLVRLVENWLRRLTALHGEVQLHAACLFLEEAQMYADTDNIVDLITRMRHLGVTPVFITNDPTTLPDELYANIDNIVSFLFKNEKEISQLGRAGLLDADTLSLLKTLERQQCLVVGEFTNDFPLFVKILRQDGVQMKGETRRLIK